MKAKLIKTEVNYLLEDDKGVVIASTSLKEEFNSLCKENCDEIFGVVDVIDIVYKQVRNGFDGVIDSFTEAFAKECINKAMELNKDKVFTLKDVKQAIFNFANYDRKTISELDRMDMAIASIQQPTEIDVGIETETKVWEFISNGEFESFEIIPKLDENGCLILRKK
jgi:imidazolonepropionase-like amidohydrolase